MRCKDIKRLLLEKESPEENRNGKTLHELEEHISSCPDCRQYQEVLDRIRESIQNFPLSPPQELSAKTRLLCLRAICSPATEKKEGVDTPIPKWIWGVLPVLIILTGAVILPVIKEYLQDQTLNFPSAAVLTLLLQNAVMLVFTPVLLRRFRKKSWNLEASPGR